MRAKVDIEETFVEFGDTVFRACSVYLRNKSDCEDATQDTFLKYARADGAVFENSEHKKAWLIHVANNVCKDMLKKSSFKDSSFDALAEDGFEVGVEESSSDEGLEFGDLRKALFSLPETYRVPIYLHYYEGYSAEQIGKLIGKRKNAVYTRLNRGRTMLREVLSNE